MDNELKKFLVAAKQKTYAAGGEGSAKSLADGRKEYVFGQDVFKYIDRYSGHEQFSGREEVWRDEKLVWFMDYEGGMLSEDISADDAYIFLRSALKDIPEDHPFRGQESFKEKGYEYLNEIGGDIDEFSGTEKIFYNNELVYQLEYRGGVVN